MKSLLVTTAFAAIALVLPTTASATALSDLLDIDTASIEDLIPGADINILTGGSGSSASAAAASTSTGKSGSCGTPTFKTPTCGGGSFVPSFGFGVTPIASISIEITISINISIDIDLDGDFGSPVASPSRCCVCKGF